MRFARRLCVVVVGVCAAFQVGEVKAQFTCKMICDNIAMIDAAVAKDRKAMAAINEKIAGKVKQIMLLDPNNTYLPKMITEKTCTDAMNSYLIAAQSNPLLTPAEIVKFKQIAAIYKEIIVVWKQWFALQLRVSNYLTSRVNWVEKEKLLNCACAKK